MNKNINEELQSATFDRLLKHLDNRTLAIITSILLIFVSIRMGLEFLFNQFFIIRFSNKINTNANSY